MNKIIYDKKPKSLISYRQGSYYVVLNVQPEYKEETKFKNSAFVKTGKLVSTGAYTGYELKFCSSTKGLKFHTMCELIMDAISKYVSETILSGFMWNGYKVWLSAENQQNYASWLMAAKSNPSILPLEAKFNYGLMDDVVYYNFTSIEELEDFYSKMVKHINDTVSFGRKLKADFESNLFLYQKSLS